jgi:hypothetical protein
MPLVAAEPVGEGLLVVSGDTNVFSDFSDDGYAEHDNGKLVANLCDGKLATELEATPAVASVSVNSQIVYAPAFQAQLTTPPGLPFPSPHARRRRPGGARVLGADERGRLRVLLRADGHREDAGRGRLRGRLRRDRAADRLQR